MNADAQFRRVAISLLNGVSCEAISNVITITVLPASVGGTISGGGGVCSGNTSALLTLSGQVGVVLKWQSAVAPFSVWNDIVNTTTTFTSGALTVPTQFRAVVQSGFCAVAYSTPAIVSINPPIPVLPGLISGLTTQCAGVTGQVYSISSVANATSYLWSVPAGWSITAGQGTNSITTTAGVAGTTFNIAVAAVNSCGSSLDQFLSVQVIGIPSAPLSISGNPSSCPVSSEIYSVAPVAGATSYTWTVPAGWLITNGDGTSAITVSTGTAGQNGDITVRAGNDCGSSLATTKLPVTISSPPVAPLAATPTQPGCTVATGSVLLSGLPAGNWVVTKYPGAVAIPSSGTTYTVNGLNPSTTYNFTVSNSNGCTSPLSADVVIAASASSPSVPTISSFTQPDCGQSKGKIVLKDLPATGEWTLTSLSDGTIWTGTGVTKTITDLSPATYSFVVTDSAGCISLPSESQVITAQPQLPATPTAIKGGATQCAQVYENYRIDKVPGATDYTWTLPVGWTFDSGEKTDSIVVKTGSVGQGGKVTVVANGTCGTSLPQELIVQISTPPSAPTVGPRVQPTCPVPTGAVTLNNLPAAGSWSLTRLQDGEVTEGSGTSIVLSGLVPNTYTYTVTNAEGCVSAPSANVVIVANPSTPATPSVGVPTQPSCALANGSVLLSGLPAGDWTINPGNISGNTTTTTIADLVSGKYNFTVTDLNGCSALESDTVIILPQPLTPAIPGAINGSVSNCAAQIETYTIAAVPSATTYTWAIPPTGWSIISGQGTTALTVKTGAAGDNGNISVTAGNTCGTSIPKVQFVSVSLAPNAPTVASTIQPTCTDPKGAVILSDLPAGDWEINPGAIKGMTSSYKIYDLNPGNHSFTVTNSAGCTSPATQVNIIANLSTPTTPIASAPIQPSCTVATGTVTLSGLPAGIWTIEPGNIVDTGTSKTISGLLPGKYPFTVINASLCTSLPVEVVITPSASAPATPMVTAISQPTCSVLTGSVTLSELPSGNWTLTTFPGGVKRNGLGTSYPVTGLSPGTYSFMVENSGGCVSLVSDNVSITMAPQTPATPNIQSVVQPNCDTSVGTIVLSNLPATGDWTVTRMPDGVLTKGSNSATLTVSDLSAGTYRFTVTNEAGCTSIATTNTVLNPATLPPVPTVSFVAQPTLSEATGTISFTPQSGVEYSINGTDYQSLTIFNNVQPGTYTLTVRKAVDHSCKAEAVSKVTLSSVGPKTIADFVKVNENDSITISVLANDDFGQEFPKAAPIVASTALHGSVTVLDNGTPENPKDDKLLYIPELYFDGTDSLSYTICSENGHCSTASVIVNVADLDQLILVTKKVTKPLIRKDGTYGLTYSIVLKNKTANTISKIQVMDDLSKTFLSPVTFKVENVFTSERLKQNSQYDGAYDLNTLLGTGQLLGNESDSIRIMVQIDPNGYTGAVYNQAVMSGFSVDGPMYNVRSDDGSMELIPKKTESELSAIKIITPAAFTPNGDGLNDKYVIQHSSVMKVKFQVFNRWGSVVFKNDDYQSEWDGKGMGLYANQDLPNGTYYYVVELKNLQTGELVQKNGYISLKR